MKKYVWSALALGGALCLISWGLKGHRAMATIAQKHLTSNTAYVVSAYLGGSSMADVSTWADENRDRATAPWHFLNLPLGLSHEQFVKLVSQSDGSVYSAIVKTEAQLKDKSLSAEQKNEALKYLIHLVGDAHQPMHVSRKEDKGGNTIQIRFDNKGTNLHSLWDSRLLDHEGMSEAEIIKAYDTAKPEQIKAWQKDSPLEWLWESYQISSQLYAEIKPGQAIDEAYYQKYIPVIRQRIDRAGIRLAGELNRLFNNEPVPAVKLAAAVQTTAPAGLVRLEELKNFVGKSVSVQGKVYSVKDIGSMVLANMGAAYPNQMLTLAFKGKTKALAGTLEGKTVSISGQVIDYKGKPEIIITTADQVKVQ
ncbi:MAG: S1/P1 nuclease [Mucilaginibacter sp.]|nr:S1/P1 nuclease [Mucilaginibacter sp.]